MVSDLKKNIQSKYPGKKILRLINKISQLSAEVFEPDNFYPKIYSELKKLLPIDAIFIALADQQIVSNIDQIVFLKSETKSIGSRAIKTVCEEISAYSRVIGRDSIISKNEYCELIKAKKVSPLKIIPEECQCFVIQLKKRYLGVIGIMHFDKHDALPTWSSGLLKYLASQLALVVDRFDYQSELNNQTARLRGIFETSSHQFWSVNLDYQLTTCNRNYLIANNKYFDKKPLIILAGDDKATAYDKFWKIQYQKVFKGNKLDFEINFHDGKNSIWYQVFLNPIFNSENRVIEVSGISQDITDKKQAEIALTENEKEFRNIFESFQDLYFRCDTKGKITMISPSAHDILGYYPKEILGKPLVNFQVKSGESILLSGISKTKHLKNHELILKRKDNKEVHFICNIRLLKKLDPVESPIIEIVARDITKLIKANQDVLEAKEIAEKSLKAKERFLANMSHEIRTPMNGIIGTMDLLSKTSLMPKQLDYIETIKTSSHTLLDILNNVLDYSRIEMGKMELRTKAFDLETMMSKLLAMFSHQAEIKGIDLKSKITDLTPTIIIGDEIRILQILSNLLSNAIKFTHQGSITIDIRSKLVKHSIYKFIAKVKDTGIGISKTDQTKLFEDFTQLDSSVTKSYHGAGLGLAISKELCKLMDGKIGVTSSWGKGSTFWFTFFVRKSKEKLKLKPQEQSPDQFYFENNPRVLLAEDNKVNHKIAEEILIKMGCRVDIVLNGQQAIDKVKSINYDIILMDIQMPVMDGIKAAKFIKRGNPKNCPPIIAMTAFSATDDEMKFKGESFSGLISKPISTSNLGSILSKVLKVRNAKRSTKAGYKDLSKILNLFVIDQLRKYCSEEVINETLFDFEIETKQSIKDITLLIKKNDHKEILSKLHTLIGNSGTLGVVHVEQRAKFMEDDLRKNNINLILSDFNDLKSVFNDFQKHLTKYIPKPLD